MRRRPDTEQDLLEGAVKEVLSVSEMKEFTLSEPSELQQGVRCKVQEQHVLGFDRTRGGQEEEARESMLATLQAEQSRAEVFSAMESEHSLESLGGLQLLQQELLEDLGSFRATGEVLDYSFDMAAFDWGGLKETGLEEKICEVSGGNLYFLPS